ncbi:Uncharacterised protein [Streptococcus pneumoniae]|nr:Uncharacterised protein [Streptococcus pneumoniae]
MEHLFKMIILLPCFYFFSWIEKANRDRLEKFDRYQVMGYLAIITTYRFC